jgi:hypothetical protein
MYNSLDRFLRSLYLHVVGSARFPIMHTGTVSWPDISILLRPPLDHSPRESRVTRNLVRAVPVALISEALSRSSMYKPLSKGAEHPPHKAWLLRLKNLEFALV